jgi:hypothetical protein
MLIDKHQYNLNLLKSNPKIFLLEIDILSRRRFGELDKAIHEVKEESTRQPSCSKKKDNDSKQKQSMPFEVTL